MGLPNVQFVSPYKQRRCRQQLEMQNAEHLNDALGAIRVLGLEQIEGELKPHLNTVLTTIVQKNRGAPEQVVVSGILPILALSLRSRGSLSLLTAKLVAELAREPLVLKGFTDSGLVPALLSVLTSSDHELLLHATRAITRMSYDNRNLQDHLLRRGAVPRLVAILLRFPAKENLEEICLQALCNLSGMGVTEEAGIIWERGLSVRRGECVFRGVSPQTCGFFSSVTLVHVSQWAPGQYSVSIESIQRCSSSFWHIHRNQQATRWFPLLGWGSCYNAVKFSSKNVPRKSSLKSRVFHTLL
ncbi:rap1 GTPase-GDP dissociation stimulator 1-A isoform 1-T1 [Synchiropus picturatus]